MKIDFMAPARLLRRKMATFKPSSSRLGDLDRWRPISGTLYPREQASRAKLEAKFGPL